MGGEPTFVSIDDMESEQWNTAANGKEKRLLSHELIFRLRDKFGPGGMIHYGQGKWYPGKLLPRWQYGLFWRKDGYPIWKNLGLIANEKTPHAYTYKEAQTFIKELSKHLAVSPDNVSTAYEDVFFFLWSEGKTPVNIDPFATNLKDSIERRTLAQLLDRGLDVPAGYVLPIRWNYDNDQWQSCKWVFNREHMFLMPGNSPIGLRLPLESLPVISKEDTPQIVERSLFEELPELEHFNETIKKRYGLETEHPAKPKKIEEIIGEEKGEATENNETAETENITHKLEVFKTALCIEAREGIIYIFIPPMDYLEHYLDLVASIEATAIKLKFPVRIEGYEPPRDYLVERLVVSPDPGVIEVNIHPAAT